jgi:hypothetical protein
VERVRASPAARNDRPGTSKPHPRIHLGRVASAAVFHGDTFQADIPFWPFALSTVANSVIYTHFYLAEGRRLAGALLLHASSNTAVLVFLMVPADKGRVAPFIAASGATTIVGLMLLIKLLRDPLAAEHRTGKGFVPR